MFLLTRKAFDDSDFNKDGYLDKEERSELCRIEVAASRGISVKDPPRCESCSYGYFVALYPSCCINLMNSNAAGAL